MIERHLQRLRARDSINEQEEAAIRGAIAEYRDIPAQTTFLPAGKDLDFSTMLLDGLMCRYKDLRNGERQISELHVPGDFADLHSFSLKHLDHSVMTLTACKIAVVPHEKLEAITREHPHLTRVYWFLTNLDAAIHREWELSLGRRTAISRTAHLFCELHARLALVDLADDEGYALPFSQTVLAECVGLTSVHVNRVLRELRERGLVDFRRGRVRLLDLNGLKQLAEFDPAFLYLEKRDR